MVAKSEAGLAKVDDDTVQPGLKAIRVTESVQPNESGQKRILDDVFGVDGTHDPGGEL